MPIIKSVEITNFRSLPHKEIPIAKNITIVSGRNATCKTTLLGIISHPFGSRKSSPELDIWGKPMVSKFGEIFKFSNIHDGACNHEYVINLYQNTPHGKSVQVKAYNRSSKELENYDEDDDDIVSANQSFKPPRFVVGKTRLSGQGHLKYPVMYLGLKRLLPIGETTKLKITPSTFTSDENMWFTDWYRKIMADPIVVKTSLTNSSKEKDSIGFSTETYDASTNSAGQDNIGKIIGATLSFKRLKENSTPENKYNGGILIIDEIDASLHPAGQRSLFSFLYTMSKQYDIQIIVTTHSLEFIREASEQQRLADHPTRIGIIYFLRKPLGEGFAIDFEHNPPLSYIEQDINLLLNKPNKKTSNKVSVYVEDNEAKLILKSIFSSEINRRVNITSMDLGCGELNKLVTIYLPKIKELQSLFIVLDGDQSTENAKIVSMPGGKSPERIIFDLLENKAQNPSDPFWINSRGYTCPHYFQNRPTTEEYSNREIIKIWFNGELHRGSWGVNGKEIFNIYKKEHASEILEFNIKFKKKLNEYFKKVGMDIIE